VREIERDGDGTRSLRRKPFVAEIAIGPEGDAAEGEIVVKLVKSRLELGAFNT